MSCALAKEMLCFPCRINASSEMRCTMQIPTFDLFKRDNSGRLIWLGVADDLKAAARQLKDLASSAPGEYLVFSQQTQKMAAVEAAK